MKRLVGLLIIIGAIMPAVVHAGKARISASYATGMNLAVEEDTIQDTERNHISEQFGYMVFESAVVFP